MAAGQLSAWGQGGTGGNSLNTVYFNTTTSSATTVSTWVTGNNVVTIQPQGSITIPAQYSYDYSDPENITDFMISDLIRKKGGLAIWKRGAGKFVKGNRLIQLTPAQEKENRELVKKGLPAKHKPKLGSFKALEYDLPKDADFPMPDGSILKIDDKGNYIVEDKNAKVTYRANREREFNRFINASDLLELFIGDAGRLAGATQTDVLELPIEVFINWLIRKAAEADGDSTVGLPEVRLPLLSGPPTKKAIPHCQVCGRFLKKKWAAAKIAFCSPEHMSMQLARIT